MHIIFTMGYIKGATKKEETAMIMDRIALILAVIGGLNWGCIGIFKFDIIAYLFGNMSSVSRVIYTLVGLSAVWCISLLFRERAFADEEI